MGEPTRMPGQPPSGLRGDIARLFSARGTHQGRPSLWLALQRAITRPGPKELKVRLGRETSLPSE